jgi:hypothetical protein
LLTQALIRRRQYEPEQKQTADWLVGRPGKH